MILYVRIRYNTIYDILEIELLVFCQHSFK